jgi:flagellar biosynthesis protein FlhF
MDYDMETLSDLPERQESPKERQTYNYDVVRKRNNKPVRSKTADNPEIRLEAHDLQKRFSRLRRDSAGSGKVGLRQNRKKPSPAEVAKWRDSVVEQIGVNPLTLTENAKPRVVAMIGPTGVGKTTSAAKLAAWFSLRENRRVALLSMDCYRIGATDQLRTYARIMRLPCEVVLRKRDLANAVCRHSNRDLVIIDTAGKNPYDLEHIEELQTWFSLLGNIQPYLVVSATTKKVDLTNILKAYSPMDVNGLIISKVDETRTYASLCQQVAVSGLPVSYLACGQRVPEDFFAASKPYLHTLFKKGWQGFSTMLEQDC